MVEELGHMLKGSTRFSKLGMVHCFHQFKIEETARKLFTLRTPQGLYRYKRLVMGNNLASSECHKWVREVGKGCEGVAQIKDNILVHSTKDTHEGRLRKVLYKLKETGLTLRWVKCELVIAKMEWFGHRFSGAADKADQQTVAQSRDG